MLKYQKENVVNIDTGKLWVFQETLSLGSNTLINFFIIFQETLSLGVHPLRNDRIIRIIKYWIKILNLPDSSPIRKVYKLSLENIEHFKSLPKAK